MRSRLTFALACLLGITPTVFAQEFPRPAEPVDSPCIHPRDISTARSLAPPGCVQINVNSGGLNILGDAANDPSISIDRSAPDRVVVAWRQYNSVQSSFREAASARSTDGGQHWSPSQIIEPGVYRYSASLEISPSGEFYLYSPHRYTTPGHDVFRSVDGGLTWSNAYATPYGALAAIAVDRTNGIGKGNLYVTWDPYQSCCGFVSFSRSSDNGQHWMNPLLVSLYFGSLSIGRTGEVYLLGAHYPYLYLARSANAKDPWTVPTFSTSFINLGGELRHYAGPNQGGLLGRHWVSVDQSAGPNGGNIYAVGVMGAVPPADPADVMLARSRDGGVTWDPPVRINNDPPGSKAWQWFPTLSVSPNGRIDVAWNDNRESPVNMFRTRLYYSNSTDGGEHWSPQIPITPEWDASLGWPGEINIGDSYQMISDDQAANLVFAATFNGEQDVFFTRIVPSDCNRNGVQDSEDIAGGTSADCNANGVPDECELDCDANGRPDACDLADGLATDCNANGLLDQCDLAAGVPDCNANGLPDACDIASGISQDCNLNGVPDSCDIANGGFADCNGNLVPDDCDLANGTEHDCNGNQNPDSCDIASGADGDCNLNTVPDSCDLASHTSRDCNQNAVPDECDTSSGLEPDCDGNHVIDWCEISSPHTALHFDGANDLIFIPESPTLKPAQEFTIESWVRAEPTGGADSRILRNRTATSPGVSLSTAFQSDRRFQLRVDFAANGSLVLADPHPLSNYEDGWHHVAAVYSAIQNAARLYVDGTLVNSSAAVGLANYGTTPLYLGGSPLTSRDSFAGSLDEVRIWGTARTALQIQENYMRRLDASEQGLIACWHFDEGAEQIVADSSPNGNFGWLGRFDTLDSSDPAWTTQSSPLILNDCDGNGVMDACEPDTLPPAPNPMSFSATPAGVSVSSIAMQALEAGDCATPPVSYEFAFTGTDSTQPGHSSGWILQRNYTDSALAPNSLYRYRVRARDAASPPNLTGFSPESAGCTQVNSPAGIEVVSIGQSNLEAHALGSFANLHTGVTGFYFELVPPDGAGANTWTPEPNVQISGLTPGTRYRLRVKARNQLGTETEFSPARRVNTAPLPGPLSPYAE